MGVISKVIIQYCVYVAQTPQNKHKTGRNARDKFNCN